MQIQDFIEKYEDELLAEWSNLVKPETFPAFCEIKFNEYQLSGVN